MSRWIKIEDKRPEENQKVIYYFKKTGISIGYYSENKDRIRYFYGPDGWLGDGVINSAPRHIPCLTRPKKNSLSITPLARFI